MEVGGWKGVCVCGGGGWYELFGEGRKKTCGGVAQNLPRNFADFFDEMNNSTETDRQTDRDRECVSV